MDRRLLLAGATLALAASHGCGSGRRGFNPGGGLGSVTGTSTATTTAGGAGGDGATSGGGSGAGAGGSSGDCGDRSYDGDTCQTCMVGFCCQEMKDCESGTPCDQLVDCRLLCSQGDSGCLDQCLADYPAGVESLGVLQDCFDQSCDGPCNGFPICDTGFVAPDLQCANCLGATCCNELHACENDQDCNLCYLTADEAACQATTLDDEAKQCELDNCQMFCGSE